MTTTAPGPQEAVAVRDRHGGRHDRPLAAHAHRALFARLLLVPSSGSWRHVWPAKRLPDGRLIAYRRQPRAWFGPDDDVGVLLERAAAWEQRGLEVFAALLPRSTPEPSARVVAGGDRVWCDVDGDPDRLLAFCRRQPPHYLGASGGRAGGRHAVWLLDRAHEPSEIASANRRLADAVGGDVAVCFAAGSLRLPGTRNHKPGGGWCRILRADAHRPGYDLGDLVGPLPEPRGPVAARSGTAAARRAGEPRRRDPLAAIPPAAYVQALCRIRLPEGGGLISCPLPDHPDRHPSCHVGATAQDGWRCFSHPGGPVGGRIYDLASALLGGPTGPALRGSAFLRARQHVLDRLAEPSPAG